MKTFQLQITLEGESYNGFSTHETKTFTIQASSPDRAANKIRTLYSDLVVRVMSCEEIKN
jgi:hypothetical protein